MKSHVKRQRNNILKMLKLIVKSKLLNNDPCKANDVRQFLFKCVSETRKIVLNNEKYITKIPNESISVFNITCLDKQLKLSYTYE